MEKVKYEFQTSIGYTSEAVCNGSRTESNGWGFADTVMGSTKSI